MSASTMLLRASLYALLHRLPCVPDDEKTKKHQTNVVETRQNDTSCALDALACLQCSRSAGGEAVSPIGADGEDVSPPEHRLAF